MLGYSPEELRQGLLNWRALTPPERLDSEILAAKAAAQATGQVAPYEKEFIRKDGTRVPVLLGGTFLNGTSGEAICFVLDLTDRRAPSRSATGPAASCAATRSACAWPARRDGTAGGNTTPPRATASSPRSWPKCSACPRSRRRKRGKRGGSASTPTTASASSTCATRSSHAGPITRSNTASSTPAGSSAGSQSRGRVHRDESGSAVRFVGMASDVTERKRLEEALRDGRPAQDEFLALLAHELRNPLAPIRNGLQLMKLSPNRRRPRRPSR